MEHLNGVIRVAELITGDNYTDPKGKHYTEHGNKTVVGIADMIETTTAVRELHDALERATPWLAKLIADGLHKNTAIPNDAIRALRMAEAALHHAATPLSRTP